ncbi:MAG: ATP-binding cassette domain-containing protein [Anaerolineales bacterium]|jgi:ABC-type lipoprotein export system ATPase subunit
MKHPPAQAMIELQKVIKTYKNAAGEFTVLKGVNLLLQKGEFVAIVGKSGSGKSTLLNMITGIDHPSAGKVVIGGTDIYQMSESARSLWRGRNLGVVFQFFQLLPMLTLLENVMLPMDYVGMYDFYERPRRAMQLLKLVGLEEQADKLPVAVSTGQQQSAAIARALANDPPVICADEPTGNLDTRSADIIIKLFESLVKKGKTIAMVTHDPSLTERTTRTIIISDGELIDETVAECLPLLDHSQMLDATRQLEHFTFPPKCDILQAGDNIDYFYMVKSGAVEVVLKCDPKIEDGVVIARMGPGQFFGEIELVRGGLSLACVRVTPEAPVELVALHRAAFQKLVSESPLTEEAIGRIVQMRLAENRTADQRRKRRET